MATAAEDPNLGSGPDEEDASLSVSESDSDSILSDDSVLPDYTSKITNGHEASTLYQACARNDPVSLRKVLERGVTKEEVMEVDINGWVRESCSYCNNTQPVNHSFGLLRCLNVKQYHWFSLLNISNRMAWCWLAAKVLWTLYTGFTAVPL